MIVLIFAVRIPSYGQILVYKGDTLSCYTEYEVDKITRQSIRVKELDTALKIERVLNSNLLKQIDKYEAIQIKDSLINQELIAKSELLGTAYNEEKKSRETAEKKLTKSNRQVRMWRTLTGIVGAAGITVYFLK